MVDFSKINAVDVAKKKYGTKEKICWPGPIINTLHQFNNACFGIVNEFAQDPGNADEIKSSPAGKACRQGIIDQMYLSGLSPTVSYNAYSPPILSYSPQLYKNSYKLTKNPEEALKMCRNLAKNTEDKDMCLLCHEALLATFNNPIPVNDCVGHICPSNNNYDCNYNNIKENFEDETKQTKGGCGCNGVAIAFWVILGVIALMLIIWSILLIWKRKKN